jgi:Protein of unknown function (DUF2829)
MTQVYYGTKRLTAKSMNRADYNTFRGWTLPVDENGLDEGYLVEYKDGGKPNVKGCEGYVSWSPRDVFEAAYQSLHALSFGHALEVLKAGGRVARAGWNGKGMFVYHVPANAYPAQTEIAKRHWGEGALVPYRAYLALKTVDGDVSTWVPSITDVLADDWMALE